MNNLMSLKERKEEFEKNINIAESKKLTFKGVEGYTVYNCSIPFKYEGKMYIFGRVERLEEWARSWVRLFEKTGDDEWTLVPGSMIYQLEDPFISIIGGEIVLGGTHVRYNQGKIDTFYSYFYHGSKVDDLYYFTTGPDRMKDVRLVELDNGKIGVFSRPRTPEIAKKYGSEAVVGFSIINNLSELNKDVIHNAEVIPGLFGSGEWGGCNQCYYLDSGLIGVIGHKSYKDIDADGDELLVYINTSFVFNPKTFKVENEKIIGTRKCYQEGMPKYKRLADVVFSSGIVMREDGNADLYSGIGDSEEGRMVIPYPFEGYGKIINR